MGLEAPLYEDAGFCYPKPFLQFKSRFLLFKLYFFFILTVQNPIFPF